MSGEPIESEDMEFNSLRVVASTENVKSRFSADGAIYFGSRPPKTGFAINIVELAKNVNGDWLLM